MVALATCLLLVLYWAWGVSGDSTPPSSPQPTAYSDFYPYPASPYDDPYNSAISISSDSPSTIVSYEVSLETVWFTVTFTSVISGTRGQTYTYPTAVSPADSSRDPSANETTALSAGLSSQTSLGLSSLAGTSSSNTSTSASTTIYSAGTTLVTTPAVSIASPTPPLVVSSISPSTFATSTRNLSSESNPWMSPSSISSLSSLASQSSVTSASIQNGLTTSSSPVELSSTTSSWAELTSLSSIPSSPILDPSTGSGFFSRQTSNPFSTGITKSSSGSPLSAGPLSTSNSTMASNPTLTQSPPSNSSSSSSKTSIFVSTVTPGSSPGSFLSSLQPSSTPTMASGATPTQVLPSDSGSSSSQTGTLLSTASTESSSSTLAATSPQPWTSSFSTLHPTPAQSLPSESGSSSSQISTTMSTTKTEPSFDSSASSLQPSSQPATVSNPSPSHNFSSGSGSTSGQTTSSTASSTSQGENSVQFPSTTQSESASSTSAQQSSPSVPSAASPVTVGDSASPSLAAPTTDATDTLIVPIPTGFTFSSLSLPPPFTLTSIPEYTPIPSASSTSSTSSSSTLSSSSTISSSTTPTPSANASVPYIAPIHQIKLDNATYYMNPYCDEEPQVLWLSDGTNFTLFCDRVELFNGTVYSRPDDIAQDNDCSQLGLFLHDVCWFKRFEFKKSDDDTSNSTAEWCNTIITPHSSLLTAVHDTTPNPIDDHIKEIANKLANMNQWTCEASKAMLGLTVSLFNMAMKPETIMTEIDDIIKGFFSLITSQTDDLLGRVYAWIDHVDETFLDLYCYVDTETGRTGRIWRSLTHHHHLHVGLNVMISINRAAQVNFIIKIFMDILKIIIKGLRMRYLSVIGIWGEALQAMGQLTRGCNTNWTEPAIRNPGDEPPEEEDEDGREFRYWVEGGTFSSVAQLWTVEGVLGVPVGGVSDDDEEGPWEISEASQDGVPPALMVDLSPMQAMMAKAALAGQMTLSKMWTWDDFYSMTKEKHFPDDIRDATREKLNLSNQPPPQAAENNVTHPPNVTANGAGAAHEFVNPPQQPIFYPVGNMVDTNPDKDDNGEEIDQLPFIPRPKGKDTKYKVYNYHQSQGAGTWIFFLDMGFTTAQYEAPGQDLDGRTIRKHAVKHQYTLPKMETYYGAKVVWPTPEDIEDKEWPEEARLERGHGMFMVSVAAGKRFGVAKKANLYFIKVVGGAYRNDPSTNPPGSFNPVDTGPTTPQALWRAFEVIYSEVSGPNPRIPPQKSVVSISLGLRADQSTPAFNDGDFARVWNIWHPVLDGLGVTFVLSAANDGFDPHTGQVKLFTDDDGLVQSRIKHNSPAILVGGVYPDGSLWEYSSPVDPRRRTAEISIYGLAAEVSAYGSGLNGQIKPFYGLKGCSFAAAQVAGLAAYFLGYDAWPQGGNPFDLNNPFPTIPSDPLPRDTVGMRVKYYMRSASYQRVPDNQLTAYAMRPGGVLDTYGYQFPYPPPFWVNSAYNLANSIQRCYAVPGIPAGRFELDGNRTTLDVCPVPVDPGNNATVSISATAPSETSTWSADDAPTTLIWTVTTNSTTYVSEFTWSPTSEAMATPLFTNSSSSTVTVMATLTSTLTTMSSSSSTRNTTTFIIPPATPPTSATVTRSSSVTSPRLTQSTQFHLNPTTSMTFRLSTATMTLNPDPVSIECWGPRPNTPEPLDPDLTNTTAQEFCAGGPDGTYGGYFPHGIPDNISTIDHHSVLVLASFPGQVSKDDPSNFTGLVYVADLIGPTKPTSGEWTVRRCQLYFGKLLEMCTGFFGGAAYDEYGAAWRLFADPYDTPYQPAWCWNVESPVSRCSEWDLGTVAEEGVDTAS